MKPQKFFYILIGILVLTLGAGGAGYYYAVKYLNSASTKLQEQYTAQNDADAQIDQLAKLKAQYTKVVLPQQAALDAALPREKAQTEILAQIERVAAASGITLTSISFPNSAGPSATSQAIKSGVVLALPISFQTSGTYAQLETFLSSLERLDRYTSITNLAVTKSDPKKVSFAINLNAYFKP